MQKLIKHPALIIHYITLLKVTFTLVRGTIASQATSRVFVRKPKPSRRAPRAQVSCVMAVWPGCYHEGVLRKVRGGQEMRPIDVYLVIDSLLQCLTWVCDVHP